MGESTSKSKWVYARKPLCVTLIVAAILTPILFVNLQPDPKIGLKSLNVLRFNISASEITATWDVEFLARNPNFVDDFSYKHAVLSVYYKSKQFSEEAVIPKIYLPSRTTKSYSGKAVAREKRIEDPIISDALAKDLSKGIVAFTVRLQETDVPRNNPTILDVTCANISVGFKANHEDAYDSTMMLAPKCTSSTDEHQAYARCSSSARS